MDDMVGSAEALATRLPGSVDAGPTGLRVRLDGTSIGYRYVNLGDFAFEIWQGGDFDVTVRLFEPFAFGAGEAAPKESTPAPQTSRSSRPF